MLIVDGWMVTAMIMAIVMMMSDDMTTITIAMSSNTKCDCDI